MEFLTSYEAWIAVAPHPMKPALLWIAAETTQYSELDPPRHKYLPSNITHFRLGIYLSNLVFCNLEDPGWCHPGRSLYAQEYRQRCHAPYGSTKSMHLAFEASVGFPATSYTPPNHSPLIIKLKCMTLQYRIRSIPDQRHSFIHLRDRRIQRRRTMAVEVEISGGD